MTKKKIARKIATYAMAASMIGGSIKSKQSTTSIF